MTTFALHWRRDTDEPDREAAEALARGLSRLRPDPIACWSRGPLTLWHFAEDPWFSVHEHPAGFVAIVAGRLDAFADLVRSVGGTSAVGEDPTDADVLAAAYAKWGLACLPHLLGDFVAIVWEPRERTLLIARDRVGVAPLYYWESTDDVVVAGHLGGIMAHPAVPSAPNEGFVAEVLSFDIRTRTETLYRDVWRLPAGHARTFRNRGGHTWEWAPEYSLTVAKWSAAEADARYRDVLTTAIRDRLRGVGRVGAELSGGLDSSTVAALAAPLVFGRDGEPLATYSLTFPGLPADESLYIEDTARFVGLNATLIPGPPVDPDQSRTEVTATRDLPLTPNSVIALAMNARARQDGARFLLSGQGGDQGFDNGFRYPLELALGGRLPAAVRAARQLSPNAPVPALVWQKIMRPLASHAAWTVIPRFSTARFPKWITPTLAHAAGDGRFTERIRPVPTVRQSRSLGFSSAWEAHILDTFRIGDALTGVRGVHPFMDSRVQQFALELDESHRWYQGLSRAIQRRAMLLRLPGSVLERTESTSFDHVVTAALSDLGQRGFFGRLRIAAECDWVHAEGVRQMYDEFDASVRAGQEPVWAWQLLLILGVERWYEVIA